MIQARGGLPVPVSGGVLCYGRWCPVFYDFLPRRARVVWRGGIGASVPLYRWMCRARWLGRAVRRGRVWPGKAGWVRVLRNVLAVLASSVPSASVLSTSVLSTSTPSSTSAPSCFQLLLFYLGPCSGVTKPLDRYRESNYLGYYLFRVTYRNARVIIPAFT